MCTETVGVFDSIKLKRFTKLCIFTHNWHGVIAQIRSLKYVKLDKINKYHYEEVSLYMHFKTAYNNYIYILPLFPWLSVA